MIRVAIAVMVLGCVGLREGADDPDGGAPDPCTQAPILTRAVGSTCDDPPAASCAAASPARRYAQAPGRPSSLTLDGPSGTSLWYRVGAPDGGWSAPRCLGGGASSSARLDNPEGVGLCVAVVPGSGLCGAYTLTVTE